MKHTFTVAALNFSWFFSVVTGATGGVGKAFAEELARRGLNIVLLDGDIEKLNEVSAEIGWFQNFLLINNQM